MRPGKPIPSGPNLPHLPGGPILGPGGLRERKKARTRRQISDVATRMFLDRGFDDVTVADVAAAAGVSVKTVFNYFGAKEDLLFDREPDWINSIDALLTERAPGQGLIRVFQADLAVRWPALDFGRWDALTDEVVAQRRRFYGLIQAYPSLLGRRLQMSERLHARIVEGVAEEFAAEQSAEAFSAATLIHAAYESAGRELYASVLAGESAKTVIARSTRVGMEALAVLERAYAGTSLVDGPPAD